MQDFRWDQKGEVDFVFKDCYVHAVSVNGMYWVWKIVLIIYLCPSGFTTFLVGVWSSGSKERGTK